MLRQNLRLRLLLGLLGVAVTGAPARLSARALRQTLKSDPQQEYYVYLPKDFDPKKEYWLFVGVHGSGGSGRGALGWAKFADEGQCIVVGPSFTGDFQFAYCDDCDSGERMAAILAELRSRYKLRPKVFMTGFSAGAQFVHRFTLVNPDQVIACAPHSAGTWQHPSPRVREVAFLITCGRADKRRIRLAQRFATKLKRLGCRVAASWFEGVGHWVCADARELTKALYWAATSDATAKPRPIAGLKRPSDLFRDPRFQVSEKDDLAEMNEREKAMMVEAMKTLAEMQEELKGTPLGEAAGRAAEEIKKGLEQPAPGKGGETKNKKPGGREDGAE